MLKVKDIHKTFKAKREKVRAVDGVSFECKQGEVYGLLGPNGAGKTTMLRIISTLLKPDSGTVVLNGVDVNKDPLNAKRSLGFMSGSTGLYDRLSAEEMVRYFGNLYGLNRNVLDERVEELFEVLQMRDFRKIKCGKLSTGMKQKVSIARTLIIDPPMLVLDEPTVGLDVITSRNIIEFIKKSRDRGKCILFSTHIMSEAEYICDRIGILHKGKLYYSGKIEQVKKEAGVKRLEDIFLKLEEKTGISIQ